MPKFVNRRKFLSQASCAAIGSTTLFNTLLNLKAMNAAAISNSSIIGTDYKALVCLTFGGGNDSFNMLMPTDTNEYSDYATTRSNLAIPEADILGLSGTDHGIHPAMTDLKDMYDD